MEERTVTPAKVELDFLVGILDVARLVLGGGRRQVVQVVAGVERVELLVRGLPRRMVVHGKGHAIRRYQALGQSQAPRLHGVCLAEVVLLHLGRGVKRDGVALGPDDAVLLCGKLHLVEEDGIFAVISLAERGVILFHDGLVDLHVVGEIVWLRRPVLVVRGGEGHGGDSE